MSKREKEVGKVPAADAGEPDRSPEIIRRDLIKRFGRYSTGVCTGLFVLMSASTSKALDSDGAV